MPHQHIIAIIPARGGSKGIPGKNTCLLAGKPLLAYSVEQAVREPRITQVYVSTDSEEIGAVAKAYGAHVIQRPDSLSGDEASSESALIHALDELETHGQVPDLIVFLQATSPIRGREDLGRSLARLEQEKADSLFSASPVHGFHWKIPKGGGPPQPITYDPYHRPRRQDLDGQLVEENGSIYVLKPWVLRKYNNRLGGKMTHFLMDPLHGFQVDDPEDLALMERILVVAGVRIHC